MSSSGPATGTTYGNRYTLTDRIAVGGMGEVWRATDQVLGRLVAIKLLSAGLAAQPGFAHRFREEARHTAALSHPNIATVYDFGEDAGASWLVMELVRGNPLSQIIRDEGAQSPQRTAAIVAQAADALQAAHEAGVIHRDVKPANIMVRSDGVVKLTDFGIARAIDAAPLTRTGEVMGTAQYISPEQAMGHPVGPASDVYSLACVAHEMLTGRRAFDDGSAVATAMAHVHKPPPPLPASVPAPMAQAIMACLAKDPAHRPASAKAVAMVMRGRPIDGAFGATAVIPTAAGATQVLTSATAYAAPSGMPTGGPRTAGTPPLGTPLPPGGGTGAGRQPRRRGRAVWLIPVLILLMAAAAWAVNQVLNGSGSPAPQPQPQPTLASPTSRTPSSSTLTTPATITIRFADYEKLTPVQAQTRLIRLGLVPRVEYVDDSRPRDRILEINPTGELVPGDTVTIRVSRGPTPTPTPTAPPTTTAPPPTTTAPTTTSEPPTTGTTRTAAATVATTDARPAARPIADTAPPDRLSPGRPHSEALHGGAG
ncbi:MAG TPA: protein kinase [Dermatophilaceae bacterium]|nr:protein kinase [Dermatophilaceae bacterium]